MFASRIDAASASTRLPLQGRKDIMAEKNPTNRVVIVSGPQGFDMQAALFSQGVDIVSEDVVVAIERPGNVEIEVLDPEE